MNVVSPSKMEELVKLQLEAYNRRDLDTFCSCYHNDVEVFRNIGDPPSVQGLAKFRDSYRQRFVDSPHLKCTIKSRTVLEKTILDEEYVTGLSGAPQGLHVVAIYAFQDDKIHRVWFAR